MTNCAFTPGPWRFAAPYVEAYTGGKPGTVIRERVAEVSISYKDTATFEANARLISTAPELYEALAALVEAVMDDDPCEAFPIAKHAGRAALAKVRGETA